MAIQDPSHLMWHACYIVHCEYYIMRKRTKQAIRYLALLRAVYVQENLVALWILNWTQDPWSRDDYRSRHVFAIPLAMWIMYTCYSSLYIHARYLHANPGGKQSWSYSLRFSHTSHNDLPCRIAAFSNCKLDGNNGCMTALEMSLRVQYWYIESRPEPGLKVSEHCHASRCSLHAVDHCIENVELSANEWSRQ